MTPLTGRGGGRTSSALGQEAFHNCTAYQTAQIGNRTARWLNTVLKDSKPVFAYLGPHAPHYPATPVSGRFP